MREPPSPALQASKAEPPKPSAVPGSTRDVFERRRDPIPFLDPNTLEVSGVEVGADSAPQTVTLRNTGPGPVRVTGSPAVTDGPWTIVPGPGTTCVTGVTLHRGQTCTVQVVFHPTSTGPDASTLTVPVSAAPNLLHGSPAPPRTATLTGAGVALTFTHTPQVDFGNVPPVTPSGLQPVTITNTGTAPQVVGPLSITGPGASDFAIDQHDVQRRPYSAGRFVHGLHPVHAQRAGSTHCHPARHALDGLDAVLGLADGLRPDRRNPGRSHSGRLRHRHRGSTPAVERTVTVSNAGNANVTIGAVSLPQGSPHFSIVGATWWTATMTALTALRAMA